jgi:hypothetical protein
MVGASKINECGVSGVSGRPYEPQELLGHSMLLGFPITSAK